MVPDELRYTDAHEWVRGSGDGPLRIGITDYAQAQLGDVVYVDLPSVGQEITAGEVCGEVESTKSVSEIYAPVSGEVVGVNDALADRPELVNSGPYDEGWMFEVRPTDPAAAGGLLDALLDADAYRELTGD